MRRDLVWLAALGLLGCAPSSQCECCDLPTPDSSLPMGTFTGPDPVATGPHVGAAGLRLVVKDQQSLVVRYERDGHTFVETWAIGP